jgi:hypothetical protein
VESSVPDHFWLEVGRAAHQLELDHGRNAYNYAEKIAIKAEQDGIKEDAMFWNAVSASLKPRMPEHD